MTEGTSHMKQVLVRADDLGYSYAVNVGIARAVREGLVRSVGLMPNMPEAAAGLDMIKGLDVAIGQHTNMCLGKPVADPALIPSLLDEDGNLKSSRTFRDAFKRGEDFVDFDEAVIEIEAQYARFKELVGAEPAYFEAHAVMSVNLNKAISHVAKAHGLKEQPASFDPTAKLVCGSTTVRMCCEDILPPDQYEPVDFIHRTVEGMEDGETVVFVFHPGYLDQFILNNSSLTVNRTKEVDALIDPELRSWIEGQADLRLIDYNDL